MENRVGDRRPSSKELEKLLSDVGSVHERLQRWGLDLQPEERAPALRMWDGMRPVLDLVVRLARQEKITVKNVSLAGIEADAIVADDAAQFESALTAALQTAADTRLQAESEAMQGFFAYYNRLAQMSETDAALATALKPATDFMATGRRRRRTDEAPSDDAKK